MKKETNLYNASAPEELQISRAELASRHHIVVQSAGLKHVIHDALKAARSKSTILITGESGTGKELIARLMHNVSPRKEKPFVVDWLWGIEELFKGNFKTNAELARYFNINRVQVGLVLSGKSRQHLQTQILELKQFYGRN